MQRIALLIILLYSVVGAQTETDIIQAVGQGHIDWGKMLIVATGVGRSDYDVSPAQHRLSALRNARSDASGRVIGILRELCLTSGLTIGEAMQKSPQIENQIRELAADLTIRNLPRMLPDSSVQITAELPLTEKLLEIVRPAIASQAELAGEHPKADISSKPDSSISELIIDIRGLGCGFALYPGIFAEDGTEIYGMLIAVSKTGTAVGNARYVAAHSIDVHWAANPIIKGIKSTGKNHCDIVISNSDAQMLILNTEFSSLLKRGKVILLVE